ncbi:replication restart DNA helicase PriA [Nitrosomonas sp. Nm51]|uniref:primosomal protein N' n=1 Tax=Nitrosomonas sp. Nm51 TaxID=133720 RepID=UPI0008AA7BE6|nr:primosomal protein N' [Nitrosomonas sp. Nm51]SEQ99531.1 replication restart DNA helicase PriA [Nitrosomonas sp. Nm51]
MPILRVALNVPLDTLFDYIAEEADENDIGLCACVPFGTKKVTGVILEVCSNSNVPPEKLKPVITIFREIPPLSSELLALFRFCSDYYHHPLGMVVMNGLPGRLRNNKPVKMKAGMNNCTQFILTEAGRRVDVSAIPARNTVMRRLLTVLRNEQLLTIRSAREISPRAVSILEDWRQKGWLEAATEVPEVRSESMGDNVPELTSEQSTAVAAITKQFNRFDTWVLHGVTGSGKTEVYLRLIAKVLTEGAQALVLIPEISLTPQLEAIFRKRFTAVRIVSLHSGLNDTERLSGWLEAQRGEAGIILGTRLAVFTPLPRLGLIIVDEEQDGSFKQQDGLRYSARDLAVFRAMQIRIPVVLGSATPSLETYYNVTTGRYRGLRLRNRAIRDAVLPKVECIDMRPEKPVNGLSAPLIHAIRKCLEQQLQCLIFINRRGYAPVLLCPSCGWAAVCKRCSSRLVVHLQDKRLSCHHCGHLEYFPCACPQCGNQDMIPFGRGTQRIEEALTTQFPLARILRIDRDSIRRKNTWQTILRAIHHREVDILVGTQLLAKGHDFPNLALVGILGPDSSLYSTDFRAGERLFTQLMQVAGRAGRAAVAGRVLVQTEFPDHPLYQALRQHDYDVLAETILKEREMAGFPPFVYQALLRAEAHSLSKVMDFLGTAKKIAKSPTGIEIFDPVPANMMRLKGMERAHLLVQSRSRKKLQSFLTYWCGQLNASTKLKVRWVLDVDPVEF